MTERTEGKPVSLWVATAGTTGYPQLVADVEVDVAVIGGGVAGLTAALALKRAGQTVAVIEAARVGTGVTGHTTGKVTSLHRLVYSELAESHGNATARTYGQANQAALEHIARTVSEERIDCGFRRVANYTYAESQAALDLVRTEADLAARLGLPSSFTTDVPLPFPVRGAVRFDGQAQLHALKYLQGLAGAVDGTAASCSRRPGPWASGTAGRPWWTPSGVPSGHGTSSWPRMCRSGTGDLRRAVLPAPLLHRRQPAPAGPALDATFISVDEPMRSILTVDVDGASYVLTGGEGHRVSDGGDTAARYPGSRPSPATASAPARPPTAGPRRTPCPWTGCPTSGSCSPTRKHVHVITGLRKWGLTNGTAAALILTDTLSAGTTPGPRCSTATGPRRRRRRAPIPGGSAPAGQRGAPEPSRPAARIPAPGAGTVVELDGELTAVYTDPAGKIQAVSAVCTHLGCTVGFNAEDVSWDCPCHGSRFATDGTVIQGPATKDLAPKATALPSRKVAREMWALNKADKSVTAVVRF